MFAYLRGKIGAKQKESIWLEVGGIGYEIFFPPEMVAKLPAPGEEAVIYICPQARENTLQLFGFLEPAEREWFLLLTRVNGIGPRLAQAILSVIPPAKLGQVILQGNSDMLTQVPGVGSKTAQRVVFELKSKVLPADEKKTLAEVTVVAEAVAALKGLGFEHEEVAGIVWQKWQEKGPSCGAGELVELALRQLGQR